MKEAWRIIKELSSELAFDVLYLLWYSIQPIRGKKYDKQSIAILKRFRVAIFLLLSSIALGTIGYFVIWNYVELEPDADRSLLNALYMAVIVLSSVGLGNVTQVDTVGKIFTIFLILINLFFYSYAVSIISTIIQDGGISLLVKKLRMIKKIAALTDHTIVCGYGRVGQQIVKQLLKQSTNIVVIEQKEESITRLEQEFAPFIGTRIFYEKGDAGSDEVLEKANIDQAKNLIIATPSEAKNVFIVLSAKRKKRDLYIVSRAVYQDDADKLLMAGADQVLIPEIEGASHMALLVQKPHLKTFFELIANSDTDSEFLEIYAHEVKKTRANLTIGDLQTLAGINVVSRNSQLNPTIHEVLKDNDDKLVIWGNSAQIKIFKQLFL